MVKLHTVRLDLINVGFSDWEKPKFAMLNKSSLNAHSEINKIIQIHALFSKHIMTEKKS